MAKKKLRIGFSIGDINAVGPETLIRVFSDKRMYDICTPILYASPNILAFYKKVLKNDTLNYHTIPDHHGVKEKTVNILRTWDDEVKISMGKHDAAQDKFALKSIENAVKDLKEYNIEALVTLPVNKSIFQLTDLRFDGHTELLANRLDETSNLMMMVCENLKVALVTNHAQIKEISPTINEALIIDKLKMFHDSLKVDFGIDKPKIGVLGLNPHTGDNGLIGREEIDVIKPAIEKAKDLGYLAFGPYPADGLFGSGNYLKFDGILAMYHDQGLIPFKMVSNNSSGGVNYTAGMKFVRTSPDHGPAYDITGKGIAKTESLIQAIYCASDIVNNRLQYAEMNANPIQKTNIKEDKKA